jgi:hypothetical protein
MKNVRIRDPERKNVRTRIRDEISQLRNTAAHSKNDTFLISVGCRIGTVSITGIVLIWMLINKNL